MKRRTAVHSGEKPHECDKCGVGFSRKGSLDLHNRRKHGKSTSSDGVPTAKNHKCLICGKFSWSTSGLKRHMRVHTREKPYECDICGMQFSYKNNLKQHLIRKHGKSTSAEGVPTTASSEMAVKNHKCLICGKLWWSPTELNRHMRMHTGEKPFKCDRCGKAFSMRSSLKRHMAVHTGEKPYECGTCGLHFSYNETLKQHCRRKHGKSTSSDSVPTTAGDEQSAKDQTCSICGKLWWSPSKLKRHMRSHTGEKPYECGVCGERFSQKWSVKRHCRRKHEKSTSDAVKKKMKKACSIGGNLLCSTSSLKQHMRVHIGEKPFQCDTCDMKFSSKGNLERHSFKVHGMSTSPERVPSPRKGIMRRCKEQHRASSHGDAATKPRSQSLAAEQDRTCPICGMVFDFPSNMKRHMVQHTGEKPYQCSICVEYFSQAAALEEHHQKMHKTGKERIPAKDRTCKFCNVLFATISELVQYSQDECTPLPYGVSIKQEEEEGQCSCSTGS